MALKLTYRFYDLPLRDAFTISRYTVTIQKTVVVCISDGEISGYGEATVNPYYHSTEQRLSDSISSVQEIVGTWPLEHPEKLWAELQPKLAHDYFALCAVDMAYWDFYARKHGRTLRSYWSRPVRELPITSYTIGIAPLNEMKRKILAMPWPVYKIKLGTANDLEIVAELRKVTRSVFRVDANAAWTASQTIAYSTELAHFGVEFIEQPLPAADKDGMRLVKAKSKLPVIADESCQREEDVLLCAGLFDGINIKLMKCGGITPALRMIGRAKEQGLLLMAGCMTESTIGISALVQLAPLLDYIDADGALLLAQDIATGASFSKGKIRFGENDGTGAEIIAF